MIPIKKCGSYLEVGSDGFVCAISSRKDLPEKWQELIDRTVNYYQSELGDDLLSVYIRGSAAKGEMIDFVSDLDSFAIVKSEIGEAPKSLDRFHKEMKEQFPFCTHVEVSLVRVEDVKKGPPQRKRSVWEELIKTQSRCVFGHDFSSEIRPFRIEEMIGHSLFLDREVKEDLPRYLKEDEGQPDELKDLCAWIMRRVLRGAFDLVLVRENKFTRDLYCCYESCSKYYPEKEKDLKETLNFSLNPSDRVDIWLPLVERMNNWIVDEKRKVSTN